MSATQKEFPNDPEIREWIEALDVLIEKQGEDKAHYLLNRLINEARKAGVNLPLRATTDYINTIPEDQEEPIPGNPRIEYRIRQIIRWNAAAMVVKANKKSSELGGHIATFASAATLYEIGFNHFWKAPNNAQNGDLIYYQGHSSPGMYSRAYLEGRLTDEQLDNFRQEVDPNTSGLSSYPHPRLMPDFWQFPTVSMGLGPIMSIYQARFLKYLDDRGLSDTKGRKVWCFIGDGEVDEPETLGAISLAAREKLDNLIWVVNCNLQRLDGPVRGNGKIVQELESNFRGTGWNVNKVLWGARWDALLDQDKDGILRKRMMEAVDGDYQTYKSKDGAYVREHFFGKYPETREMVSKMSDDDIWRLNRGGHDPHKLYAAYHQAVNHKDQPSVILAHTVKGYGMGEESQAIMAAHQKKKLAEDEMIAYAKRLEIPITDEEAADGAYYRPAEDSEEMKYLHASREKLGGYLPQRVAKSKPIKAPELDVFKQLLENSGDREISTTMGFVRILNALLRLPEYKKRIVPIVPDEARTFGMEGLFSKLGIYSSVGQTYEPQDKGTIMYYKEKKDGQVLEEGINEAGAFSSWIAAATSYSSNSEPMIPFYIYYSMFGFQRIGDLAWAAGDLRARGFLLGATAGRTTLAGEGLQHQDGHGHIMANTIPSCVSYDPTFAFELAIIIQDGIKRMYEDEEDIFYYISVMNENYVQPAMPKKLNTKDVIKGIYLFRDSKAKSKTKVQLMGSGTILNEVIEAAELLEKDWDVSANVFSVPSFNELTREARACERWNRVHPDKKAKVPFITQKLAKVDGPFIAATDYIANYADQVRAYVPGSYTVLGTDGFGRSDTRKNLREHFEVNAHYVVITALKALVDEGSVKVATLKKAIKQYNIDPEKTNPLYT